MTHNNLKNFNGQTYSGMPVGSSHDWIYPDGRWKETKVSPDEWEFNFICRKGRNTPAPINSGASLGSEYHWYILADQTVRKLDKDSYITTMQGSKFKIGHKRPHWRAWSYEYPEQLDYKHKLIQVLKETLRKLEMEE